MRIPFLAAPALATALAATALHAQSTLTPSAASAIFAEARTLSDHDANRLWGMPLYGPILLVDPGTNSIVTNVPDANGALKPAEHGTFTGALPRSFPVANTAVEWSGTRWTMVQWPLPLDTTLRGRLVAHELFHRLQQPLHLPSGNPQNPQLDTLEGRIWLQLEWRALAAALLAKGPEQSAHLQDAVAFRLRRQSLFPGSAETERQLDLNEGLAEYTGVAAAFPDLASARWRAVGRLISPGTDSTFVRSFSYVSGPAFGLLLDQRAPGWRTRLTPSSDLGALLSKTVPSAPRLVAETRALAYGGAAIRATETERAARSDAARARFRALLIDGPTLTLPTSDRLNYSFDPNTLIPLDGGNVYPTFQAVDDWGDLNAQNGAYTSPGKISLAAPTAPPSGSHLEGPGWKLELKPGWTVVPGTRPGSYLLQPAK